MRISKSMTLIIYIAFYIGVNNFIIAETIPVRLTSLDSDKNWQAAGVDITTSMIFNGQSALSLSIPLKDKPASEWFKITSPVNSKTGANWYLFDRFEFYAMSTTDMPKKNLPPIKLTCNFIGNNSKLLSSTIIEFPQIGKWVHVSIPIREIRELSKLQNIQFQFAKKWAKLNSLVKFHIAGFQLAKQSKNSIIEPCLLTESVSLEEPFLCLRAEKTSSVIIDDGPTRKVELVPSSINGEELLFDISGLRLNSGVYTVSVQNRQKNPKKTFSFQWIPVQVLDANIGEALPGINTATSEIKNAASQPVALKSIIKFDEKEIASKNFEIPLMQNRLIDIEWPLLEKRTGTIQFEIMILDNHVINRLCKNINTPGPLERIPAYMAITIDAAKEACFRVPIAIAGKSMADLHLQWKLLDSNEMERCQGTTKIDNPWPLIRIPTDVSDDTKPYSLLLTLNTNKKETKTVNIYFIKKFD